jgi:outer membrane protein TolC
MKATLLVSRYLQEKRSYLQGSESVTGSISSVTLAWLLFDFGARRNVVDAAQKISLASNILFIGVHQKIIHDVCVAYYLYLASSRHTITASKSAPECSGDSEDCQRTV